MLALRLAQWAFDYRPEPADIKLAERSLIDTVCVGMAARNEPILNVVADLSAPERWTAAAHILDFDDLHVPSTTHVSTVCVPAALFTESGAHGYLVGAGVMTRLGTALGNQHYARGWHNTATAGAVAAASIGSHALGLSVRKTAEAMALAVSSTGGVQDVFGTDAKSLQVGFATSSGLRAATLIARGASAALDALDQWIEIVGGDPAYEWQPNPAVPDGLAIKLYPCCYALQRLIGVIQSNPGKPAPELVTRVRVRTPESSLKPLIHKRPQTGVEGKFSLEYGVATAMLDSYSGFDAFTDTAVRRPEAERITQLVEVQTSPGGQGLLAGEVEVTIETTAGSYDSRLAMPSGSPENPATQQELDAKFGSCLHGTAITRADITWASSARLLDSLWDGDGAVTNPNKDGALAWTN